MTRTNFKILIALSLLAPAAHAEDVYNFYFQKSKKQKVEAEVVEAPEEVEEVLVEEVTVVPEDVLLIPDNWRPAQARKKRYYIKKTAPEPEPEPEPEPLAQTEPKSNTNTAVVDEPKEEGRGRRGWSMAIGVGTMKFGTANFFEQTIVQDVYAVGARYHMSRYFDVNAEVLLPSGNYEYSGYDSISSYYSGNNNGGISLDPQFNIGLGVTPIHLNIFGTELLEIGADGGVSVGNKYFLNGENSTVYVGPRVGINFGNHFSINYVAKLDTQNDIKYTINTISAGYRW